MTSTTPTKRATIGDEARQLLQNGQLREGVFRLPPGWVEPGVFRELRTIFQAWGGVWCKEAKGFRFGYDPRSLIEKALLLGEYVRPRNFGFFATPEAFAGQLVERADVKHGLKVLEPSAGTGNIARRLAHIVGFDRLTVIELLDCHVLKLRQFFPEAVQGDFLKMIPNPLSQFDRIVMNPPFKRQEAHVLHAWRFLKPGGRLVAVMAAGVETREGAIYQRVRDLAAQYGSIERNPADTFKESGAAVETVTLILNK